MKIVLVGGFRSDYTVGLEWSYARALRALGHDVHTVPESPQLSLRTPFPLNHAEELLRVRAAETGVAAEVERIGASLVVIIKGRCVSANTVRRWRLGGMRVLSVFPDNPFEGAASGAVAHGLLAQYRELDRCFVHDRFAVGQLRAMGVRSEFIAFARDPELHDAPPPVRPEPDAPTVVFLGNPDAERIRYLRAVADLGLVLFGAWEWARLPASDPLSACVRGTTQLGPDFVRAMRSAVCSVNVLRNSQKTAHNMRTFEAPACGACPVSEGSVGVEELFSAGSEVITFRSPAELRRAVLALRASPALAHEVALAGYEAARSHTYQRRAEELLASL